MGTKRMFWRVSASGVTTHYEGAPLWSRLLSAKTQPTKGTPLMSVKYIGLDVHQATISIAVLDAHGKLVMQSVIATQTSTILDFIHAVRGDLHIAFEEGTSAHWLYGLLKPHVSSVMV